MTGKKSTTPTVLLGCTLLLAGRCSDVRPVAAQAQLECPRPEGTGEAPTPSITAAQVEADPTGANLKTFAVEARNYLQDLSAHRDVAAYAFRVFRREGDWKAGSVYISLPPQCYEPHPGDQLHHLFLSSWWRPSFTGSSRGIGNRRGESESTAASPERNAVCPSKHPPLGAFTMRLTYSEIVLLLETDPVIATATVIGVEGTPDGTRF